MLGFSIQLKHISDPQPGSILGLSRKGYSEPMTTWVLSSTAVSALQTLYPKTWTMFTAFRVGNMFHLEAEIPELGGITLCCVKLKVSNSLNDL